MATEGASGSTCEEGQGDTASATDSGIAPRKAREKSSCANHVCRTITVVVCFVAMSLGPVLGNTRCDTRGNTSGSIRGNISPSVGYTFQCVC